MSSKSNMFKGQIKKRAYALTTIVFFGLCLLFAQKSSDDFSGKWVAEEGKIIEITKSNGVFNGTGIPEQVHVLKNVRFNNGKWEGIIHNPRNKKEAICEVELNGTDKLKVTAKIGKYRKVFLWTKVK